MHFMLLASFSVPIKKTPGPFGAGVLLRLRLDFYAFLRPSAAPHGGIIITTTLIRTRLITWRIAFIIRLFIYLVSNECLQSYHSYWLSDNIYLTYYFVSIQTKCYKHFNYQSVKPTPPLDLFLHTSSQFLILIHSLQRNFS